jgi:hypothetical protein
MLFDRVGSRAPRGSTLFTRTGQVGLKASRHNRTGLAGQRGADSPTGIFAKGLAGQHMFRFGAMEIMEMTRLLCRTRFNRKDNS